MHDNEALAVVAIGLFKFFKKHVKELFGSVNRCFRDKKAVLFIFKDLVGVIKVSNADVMQFVTTLIFDVEMKVKPTVSLVKNMCLVETWKVDEGFVRRDVFLKINGSVFREVVCEK